MEAERTPETRDTDEHKSPEELAEEVKAENPDPTRAARPTSSA